jgi:hypothetical protein
MKMIVFALFSVSGLAIGRIIDVYGLIETKTPNDVAMVYVIPLIITLIISFVLMLRLVPKATDEFNDEIALLGQTNRFAGEYQSYESRIGEKVAMYGALYIKDSVHSSREHGMEEYFLLVCTNKGDIWHKSPVNLEGKFGSQSEWSNRKLKDIQRFLRDDFIESTTIPVFKQ